MLVHKQVEEWVPNVRLIEDGDFSSNNVYCCSTSVLKSELLLAVVSLRFYSSTVLQVPLPSNFQMPEQALGWFGLHYMG